MVNNVLFLLVAAAEIKQTWGSSAWRDDEENAIVVLEYLE